MLNKNTIDQFVFENKSGFVATTPVQQLLCFVRQVIQHALYQAT